MRTLVYVWVWFAFSILGFTFLPKAETFAVTQNFESNFLITLSSETYAMSSSAYKVGLPYHCTFSIDKTGLIGTKVLGLLQIATYNPEIYSVTSTNSGLLPRTEFESNLERNGSPYAPDFTQHTDSFSKKIISEEIQVQKVEILTQDIIRLTFSEFMDPASAILPDHYSISGLPPLAVELHDNLYQLDLVLSKSLTLGDEANLRIKKIRSESGFEVSDLSIQLKYADGISGIYAIDQNTIHLILDQDFPLETIDPFSFKILEGDHTFQIQENSTAQVLKLKISPALEEGLYYNLLIPTRSSFDGDVISGSIRHFILDGSPPLPVHFSKLDHNKILVDFDEAIDPVMAVVPTHYALNGQTPTEVILVDNPYQVLLVMAENLPHEDTYELSVINIEDLQGNALSAPARISSGLKVINDPAHKSIVINEVMAAPRAGLILPNSEYVELLNLTNDEINIGGYRLHNSRSSTAIPAGTLISPGEYLLLCPNARRGMFEPFGRVIGLTSWPTLLNNADIVMLKDRQGFTIDSLGYTRSNYGSTQVAQGGYSLEVVNPYSQCNLMNNLRPSTDPSRGTPGAVNSIFDDTPDRTQPVLRNVSAVEPTHIVAVFSKPMSQDFGKANWSLTPEIKIISAEFINGGQTEIELTLDSPLAEHTRYTLKVTNLRDCSGNLIDPEGATFTFALPIAAESGDVIINEILFNPHTGTPKFVEIHNISDKYINLRNWKLGNESGGMISNRRVISGHDMVMAPQAYLAITTDAVMLSQMYPKAKNLLQIGTLPSYPIREGTVFLMNADEMLLERLDYHENMHHPLLRTPRGVSLERINPSVMPNDPQNWTSAAGANGYATPGFTNSQLYTSENIGHGITVSPEVFAPETIGAQNYTTIQYQMDNPGYTGTVKIFDISGKLIKDIVQNEIWGSSGFYLWNGTDTNGQKVKVGYYIIWVELINLEGKVINIKKSVAVGTKLR